MSFLAPFALIVLGATMSVSAGVWWFYERRLIRALVWGYAGVLLLMSGVTAAAHSHRGDLPPDVIDHASSAIDMRPSTLLATGRTHFVIWRRPYHEL